MLLLPLSHPKCRGRQVQGRLVYPDGAIDISPEQVDEAFKTQFREAIATLSSTIRPRKVPSFRECRYCDVPTQCCQERAENDLYRQPEQHNLF